MQITIQVMTTARTDPGFTEVRSPFLPNEILVGLSQRPYQLFATVRRSTVSELTQETEEKIREARRESSEDPLVFWVTPKRAQIYTASRSEE